MPFGFRLAATLAFPAILLFSFLLILAGGMSARGLAQGSGNAEATQAFEKIAEVLRHPRCLNCHQENIPLQGDMPRQHIPLVVRGEDNMGVSAMRCTNCHRETNNTASKVPGAPHWSLAPVSMTWQGLSTAELCEQITDKERNGGKSPEQLIEHMGSDPLVLWGWTPGEGREPVSMQHDDFMDVLRLWVAAGSPCPN